MSQQNREDEREWAQRMIALEEERGPFLPAGYAGVVPRARRASASKRARGNVRLISRAVHAGEGAPTNPPSPEKHAA